MGSAILTWTARWRKRQEAKTKRKRAQAALAKTWQEEQKMKEKYKEALAAYEAIAEVSDPAAERAKCSEVQR